MSVTVETERVTPEALLAMPDASTLELVDGQLVEKEVSLLSSRVEVLIATKLQDFVERNPIAGVFPASLGYRCFPDDRDKVRKPDVTVVRAERIKQLPDPDPGFMPIIPDLAVEVVSTHDTVYELGEKVREYLAARFPLVWVADPESRTVTVHAQGSRPMILTSEDEITAEAALPGFRCRVGDFFPVSD
jgi:Uma2 family endonuclease